MSRKDEKIERKRCDINMATVQRKTTNQLSQSDKAIINKAIEKCNIQHNSRRK